MADVLIFTAPVRGQQSGNEVNMSTVLLKLPDIIFHTARYAGEAQVKAPAAW
jgi:hypothetical protein